MRKAVVYYMIASRDLNRILKNGISESNFKRSYEETVRVDVSLEGSNIRICERLYRDINSGRLKVKINRGFEIGDIIKVGRDYYMCYTLGFVKIRVK